MSPHISALHLKAYAAGAYILVFKELTDNRSWISNCQVTMQSYWSKMYFSVSLFIYSNQMNMYTLALLADYELNVLTQWE